MISFVRKLLALNWLLPDRQKPFLWGLRVFLAFLLLGYLLIPLILWKLWQISRLPGGLRMNL